MATYDKQIDYDNERTFYNLKERHIYGSSRVGVRSSDVDLLALQSQIFSMQSVHYSIGSRTYELSNHLGNVLSVISDTAAGSHAVNVIPYFDGGGITEMRADIRVAQDYSPFGVTLSGRDFTVDERYRYGFNGYEGDSEVKGQGNSYTTHFRQYDPRLGRWLSLDPKKEKYPDMAPYIALGNNPLLFIDSKGDTIKVFGDNKTNWMVVGFLQTLTNDKLTLKNNQIVIEKTGGANLDKKLNNGTSLVRSIISNGKTVYIDVNKYQINNAEPLGENKNATNGKGTNVRLNIDLYNESEHLTYDSKSKKTEYTKEPRETKLAHELIHTLEIFAGTLINQDTKDSHTFIDEKGRTMIQTHNKEELETVGFTGKRKHTENKIRKEQGFRKRVKY